MAISVINNVSAMIAQRYMSINNANLTRSLERLTTGLRVNRAGDDAAGLAVGQRLLAQISGLAQASINAQDSVSLVQTAEGSLDEVEKILQRIRVLSESASTASKSDADRALYQVEVDQLLTELDRIAQVTQFSGRKLLDGSVETPKAQVDSNVAIATQVFLGTAGTEFLTGASLQTGTFVAVANCFVDESFKISIAAAPSANSVVVQVYSSLSDDTAIIARYTLNLLGGSSAATVVSFSANLGAAGAAAAGIVTIGLARGVGTADIGKSAYINSSAVEAAVTVDKGLEILVGANAGETIKLGAASVKSSDLFSNQAVNIRTMGRAQGTLNQVDHALDILHRARGTLGALQNRFESTIRSVDVYRENLTAAESRIMDLDMAAETTILTKNQVLVQSSTAMLAQANLIPQSILQLFR
ncbi:MAG: flagellin [Armatimonadetes bacterium]|nr:flagellin [Armatimonadota bacterium]